MPCHLPHYLKNSQITKFIQVLHTKNSPDLIFHLELLPCVMLEKFPFLHFCLVISQEYLSVDKFCYGILSSNGNTFHYYLTNLLFCASSIWICMELLTVTRLFICPTPNLIPSQHTNFYFLKYQMINSFTFPLNLRHVLSYFMKVLRNIPLHKNVLFCTAYLFPNAKVHQQCLTKPQHTNGIKSVSYRLLLQ
jgi:hypothetical protein